MPKKVLVDSNFLLLPAQNNVDIFDLVEKTLASKAEFILITPVIRELERIASKKEETKLKKQAMLALEISKRCVKKNFEAYAESVDDSLLRAAKEIGCIVATGDMELRRKLRKNNTPVLYLRGRGSMMLEGYVA